MKLSNHDNDHCFYGMWWLLKEPFVIDSVLSYCSKAESNIVVRSEMVSSCCAMRFRSCSSFECRICISGILDMKFPSSTTDNFCFFLGGGGNSSGCMLTNVLFRRLQSFSTSNGAFSSESSNSLSHSMVNISCNTWKENYSSIYILSALRENSAQSKRRAL